MGCMAFMDPFIDITKYSRIFVLSLICHLYHLFKASFCGFLGLSVCLLHTTNCLRPILGSFFEQLQFLVCSFDQKMIARSLRSQQVILVIELLDSGSLVRWRQTANDELADFFRSCLRAGHAVCTSEQEDAVFRNCRDTWDGVSLRVCAKCSVVPIMSVGLVKYTLTFLQFLFRVRVNLITEREDHA